MNREAVRASVLRVLKSIVPEADPATLNGQMSLRDQLDVDSMDLLNFAVGIHKEFGVDVPEADFARLMTIDGCVEYIVGSKTASAPG